MKNRTLENGFYSFKQNIVYTTFEKGDIIEVKDGSILFNKTIVPSIIQEFILSNINLLEKTKTYPIGTLVKYRHNQFGIITDVVMSDLNKSLCYIVTFPRKQSIIKVNEVVKTEIYYFISSKGKLCLDEIGRDINVEKFRKATDNFFLDKNSCNLKLLKILKKIEQ